MHIGIILFSLSGHTRKVTLRLKENLTAAGHQVTLNILEPTTQASFTQAADAPLKVIPSIDAFDALIFAVPVWGGGPATPFLTFLNQTPSLQGKPVACLVTGFFPAKWGCLQTIAKMSELAQSKSANIIGAASVTWFSLTRRRQIQRTVDKLAALF
jgi:flavodoxin